MLKNLKWFFSVLFLLPLIFVTDARSQCNVIIQPGTVQKIDVNPGIKFQFTLINNGTTTYQNGTFHMSFGWMDNPINPDPVWTFNLTNPIQPGQTRVITTPVFDVPLPANATEWPFWDDLTGPNGWPNSNYGPLMLYMNGCFLNSVTLNSFLPLSDDCPNIDGDQFCDCNVEVYDFRTEPELEMDLVIHSDYNCHPSSFPPGSTNYTQNNPSIDHIVLGIKSLSVNNNCGSSLYGYVFLSYPWTHFPEYSLGDTITLQVDQAANYPLYTCLQPAIAAGHYDNCVEAVLWQLNNSYNLLGNVNNPEITMDDNIFIINSGCPTVANTTDLGINSFTYDVIGCDVGAPYAAMDITVVNQGTTVINDFCLNLDILPDGLPSAQYCFQNLNLLPGQSYVVEVNGAPLANGVTSLSISTTGDSGLSNNSFVGTINLPCYGCTLTSAVNYNPYATVDDGTCIPTVLGCTDELANNYNPIANVDNGSCTYDVFGCTDSSANNFNPEANVDNGSCTYDVFGCTDPLANNFNPNANINDGSCTYDVFGCTDPLANNFNPDANVNDSSCTYDVYGCTDSSANNFNPEANVDNGSCTYDVFGCTDSSANNFNPNANINDGSCTYDVFGCTDSSANNFNPNANINDGSCTYDVFGCTDPLANNFNPDANVNDSSCTYDVYGCTDSSANNFNPEANVDNGSCTYDVFGCTDSSANNFNPNANINDGSCTYDVFGCTDSSANNFNPNANINDGSCTYDVFGCTDPLANNFNPDANVDNGTCTYDVFGCTDSLANNFNSSANINDGSCTYDVFGCTDSSANNFNPDANVDNGTCTYDVFGCTDSSANNFNPDANVDNGTCTYDVYGCTDSSANNFNPNANVNDGSCTYDIFGCTDSSANNFNPDANVDNGSCTYDVFGCTDSDANNFNPNANIDDGSCTYNIFGCTDVTAFNYNPNANVDNGSCLYEGCTNPQALNYDPNANLEDGTCIFAPVIDECDDVEVFVPNAFTPNNDGINDAWYVVTNNDCWLEWTLRIYNRWGGLIWETNDPNEKWIGNVHNGDYYVSDGLYVYQIIAKGEKGRVYSNTGNITVLR